MYTAESHAVDNRKFLKHQQRNAVAVAVKASPLSTPVEVRRHLKNSSPQKRIDAQRARNEEIHENQGCKGIHMA